MENREICVTSPTTTTSSCRLGGPNAVIIADVFIDPATEFPILYLADTVTIPTRSHLHALDCWVDHHQPPPAASSRPPPPRDLLLRIMQRLANNRIRAGSFLVLGPTLQHWLTPDELHTHVGHQLVPAVIAFDALKRFDCRSASAFDVADNFEEMSRWAKGVCSVACRLLVDCDGDGDGAVVDRRAVRLERLKCLLEVANALSASHAIDQSDQQQQAVLWSSLSRLCAF